jgi:hypothetical protein
MFVSCRVSCGNQITMRGIVFSSDAGLHNLQDMILTIVLTHVIHLSNIFNDLCFILYYTDTVQFYKVQNRYDIMVHFA